MGMAKGPAFAAHGRGLYQQRPHLLGTCFLSMVVEWTLAGMPFALLCTCSLLLVRPAVEDLLFIHGTRSAVNPLATGSSGPESWQITLL